MPGPISNFFMKAILNSPLHGLLGDEIGVITVAGRQTGVRYSTPVNVVKDNGVYTATSLKERRWWRNLRGGRAAVLRVSGNQQTVWGEVFEAPAEVAECLDKYFNKHPASAKHFGVRLGQDGHPARQDLEREAEKRVVVYLHPVQPSG
jgi:hypothetical protein